MSKIAVVVVTYNRKKMLLDTLNGVLSQTTTVDKIFLVNNASTDGTEQLLKEQGYLDNPNIEYVLLSKNTGGAGGFHEGIKKAHESGCDWVWVMDDDVEAKPEALEILLSYRAMSKCIQPSRETTDGREIMWEGYIDAMTGLRINLDNLSFHNGKDYTYTNVACFEGMLLHRDIIDKVSYPDKRFFIVYDDTSYGLLISQYTNILFIKAPLLIKKIVKDNEYTQFGSYYLIRNLFLQKKYIDLVFGKRYQLSRNIFFILDLFRGTTKTVIALKFKSFPVICKAIIDGFKLRNEK